MSDSNQVEEDRNDSLTTLSESLQQDKTKQTERIDMVIDQLQKQVGAMSLHISNHQVNSDKILSEKMKQDQISQKDKLDKVREDLETQLGVMTINISNIQVNSDKMSEKIKKDQISQNEKLDNANSDLQKQVGVMSLKITNQQVFMENAVVKIKEKLATPTVLFQARGIKDITPSSGETLIFKTIESNLHAGLDGGYSSKTGIFTAPVSGTYLFTVQACVYPGKYFNGQIIAAGKVIAAMRYYISGSNTCYSGSAVTTLSTGDTVYIKCNGAYSGSGSVLLDSGNYWWNMFSGVLIHTGTQ